VESTNLRAPDLQTDGATFLHDRNAVIAALTTRTDRSELPPPAHPTKMDLPGFTTFFAPTGMPFWI